MGVAKVAKTKPAVAENKIQSKIPSKIQGKALGNIQNSVQRSFRDIKSELKKVVWPSRQEATNLTMIVIVVMIAVGIFLGGVDYVFSKIIEMIIGAF